MTDRIAGKRGARESHELRLLLSHFVKTVPPAYAEWDGSHGITEWGMDCNGPDPKNPRAYPNGLGDCGAAAPDHGNMAKANNPALLGTLGQPKFAGTVATYFAYGVAQGETGQPPAPANEPDQGVDNRSWLGFLYTNGIIDGYGEVPLNELDAYAQKFGGLLLGLQLDKDAEADFEASPPVPWGTNPRDVPDPQDGHDTWLIKLHPDGSGALITWGAIQEFTARFRTANITDAWAIFDKDDPNVDWPALESALDAVHGAVTVPPAVPAPAPIPDPGWDKASVIQTILTSVVAVVVAVIAVTHPGFSEPKWLRSAIPTLAVIAASAVHLWINRKTVLAAVEKALREAAERLKGDA